ncbi:MAG: c-type cytochrome, partial [Gemmatimonadota bacterium]|nr:c-type cytochrome [Gemmatimonadota bacterium]
VLALAVVHGPLSAQSAQMGEREAEGERLARALGCGGCHTGVPFDEGIRSVAPPLGTNEVPFAPAYVFAYLADPRAVRPDIAPARMPRFDLTEAERLALSLFATNERELQGVDDAFRSAQNRHPGVARSTGRDVFLNLGCGGCHVHPEVDASQLAPDLASQGIRVREAWLTEYLSTPTTVRPAGAVPGRGSRMPDFRLTPDEVGALTAFLMARRDGVIPAWQADPLSPFSMQKAETLLRDRWSCLGCHELGEDGGRIGPGLDGLAHRLTPAFVRAFVEDPGHLAPGTVMPASLEQTDRLDLIASFLVQRPGSWTPAERTEGLSLAPAFEDEAAAAPGPGRPTADAGGRLYQRRCASCHGVEGAGDGFNAPYLPVTPTVHADAEAMALRPDDTLYDGIHAGGWILGKSHRMPAFGASLSPVEIRSLVAYIRQLCGCEGPEWSRDGRRGS